MAVTVLGVDLMSASSMAIEFEESFRISSQPSSEWSKAFWSLSSRMGLLARGIGVRFGFAGSFTDPDVHHIQVRRRMEMLDRHSVSSESEGLASLVGAVVEQTNQEVGGTPIELLGAELLPSDEFSLIVDVPVEVQVGPGDVFDVWLEKVVPAIRDAGISEGVGALWSTREGSEPKQFVMLRGVRLEYARGSLQTHVDYAGRIREISSLVAPDADDVQ